MLASTPSIGAMCPALARLNHHALHSRTTPLQTRLAPDRSATGSACQGYGGFGRSSLGARQ
jgi:hypothetical protein